MPDETPLTKAQIELLKQAIQEILEHLPIEDVKRVSAKLFNPDRLTIVVAGTPVEPSPRPRPSAPANPRPATPTRK